MKNSKVISTTQQLAQRFSKEQIIEKLKQKNLKGGSDGPVCPPPFEID